MKTAVSVPSELFRAADRKAKRLGISRSELYARALSRYLDESHAQDVTAALNRVYGEDAGNIDPVLASLQARTVDRNGW